MLAITRYFDTEQVSEQVTADTISNLMVISTVNTIATCMHALRQFLLLRTITHKLSSHIANNHSLSNWHARSNYTPNHQCIAILYRYDPGLMGDIAMGTWLL